MSDKIGRRVDSCLSVVEAQEGVHHLTHHHYMIQRDVLAWQPWLDWTVQACFLHDG